MSELHMSEDKTEFGVENSGPGSAEYRPRSSGGERPPSSSGQRPSSALRPSSARPSRPSSAKVVEFATLPTSGDSEHLESQNSRPGSAKNSARGSIGHAENHSRPSSGKKSSRGEPERNAVEELAEIPTEEENVFIMKSSETASLDGVRGFAGSNQHGRDIWVEEDDGDEELEEEDDGTMLPHVRGRSDFPGASPSYHSRGEQSSYMIRSEQSQEGSLYSPRRLIDLKRSRRQAELDAQAIRNRVERLKMEESKARKKIEETRKRADEIMRLKARNEERLRQREEIRMMKEMQVREAIQKKAMVKAERTAALKAAKIALIKEKRHGVIEQKVAQVQYIQKIEKSREHEKERAQRLKDAIRQREMGMLQRKYKQIEHQEYRAQTAYESRMAEEELERNRAANAIRRLEEEEEELIQVKGSVIYSVSLFHFFVS